ncbi:LysR substrate-binding domain-containing protein [Rodentibacter genomosp. 2]|uniref:LysR substrate-binding domain-containing protein n=1 Tax=Rodentibacter genomosp. 2 TaxID=1908266 RepID=UPI001ABFFB72
MQPTMRALTIAEPLKRILGELEQLVQPPSFDPQTLAYTFKIGLTDTSLRSIGIPFVQRLQRLAPNIRIAFLTLQPRNMEAMLEKGEIDLA